jgi:hypothetical protein
MLTDSLVGIKCATTSAFEAGESQAWMFLPEIRGGVLKDTDNVKRIKECQVAGRLIGRTWQGETSGNL